MGSRLSQPRGPAGTTETSIASKPAPPPSPKTPWSRRINSRTIVAPAAAFTMACLLFVYARTSIRAAKANAQRHRDADTGGEGLNLLNESRRRHGMREKLDTGGNTISELASEAREQFLGARASRKNFDAQQEATERSEEEKGLRALKDRMGRRPSGD